MFGLRKHEVGAVGEDAFSILTGELNELCRTFTTPARIHRLRPGASRFFSRLRLSNWEANTCRLSRTYPASLSTLVITVISHQSTLIPLHLFSDLPTDQAECTAAPTFPKEQFGKSDI